MVMMPKKSKHRKMHKGHRSGLSKGGNFVEFGEFGMQALDRGWLTGQQIEACRVAINRFFQRKGKVWIRVFPDKPVSKKPAEVRMGKGKGNPEYFVAEIQPGKMLYEMDGVNEELAREAFRLAAAKLPIRTMVTIRQIGG